MRCGIVVHDRAIKYTDAFPEGSKSADDAHNAFTEFAGGESTTGPRIIEKRYADGAP